MNPNIPASCGTANLTPSRPPIDCHVHIVGTGSSGSGCWLRSGGWRTPLEALMLWTIGLPLDALRKDFDRLYVDHLLELIRTSSLGAVAILAQDNVYRDDGTLWEDFGAFYVPNSYVLELGRQHPEFVPAVSIHPGRRDAMEELERCIVGGAAMLKLLPNCHNVDFLHSRYVRFWERMAAAGIPLLAHTGGEHTLPQTDPKLGDPRRLAVPLEAGVTVIAAHSATKSGLFDPNYLPYLVEMMGRYPRLYADNSAFHIPFRSKYFPETFKEPMLGRMIHGSDFPVPILGHWARMRGFIDGETLRRSNGIKNVLERDLMLKRAMHYSPEVFTRLWDLFPASVLKAKNIAE